jgi:hypothetical protein
MAVSPEYFASEKIRTDVTFTCPKREDIWGKKKWAYGNPVQYTIKVW